jgi:hypothetical protein
MVTEPHIKERKPYKQTLSSKNRHKMTTIGKYGSSNLIDIS